MSFQAMAWASEQKTGSATRKAVLYALANHANKDGYCYLAISTICEEAETGDTSTRTALKDLVAAGLVTRKRKRDYHGHLGIYEYTLHIARPASESDGRPPSPSDAHEPGRPSEPKDLSAASRPRERNIIWDALVDAGFAEPGTASERSNFGKTVRELREVIPEGASREDIVKAIRARKMAWEREYPSARFTINVVRAKWAELGALAVGGGVSAAVAFPSERMSAEEFREWRRTASREQVVEYQHRFDVDDQGEPLDGGF